MDNEDNNTNPFLTLSFDEDGFELSNYQEIKTEDEEILNFNDGIENITGDTTLGNHNNLNKCEYQIKTNNISENEQKLETSFFSKVNNSSIEFHCNQTDFEKEFLPSFNYNNQYKDDIKKCFTIDSTKNNTDDYSINTTESSLIKKRFVTTNLEELKKKKKGRIKNMEQIKKEKMKMHCIPFHSKDYLDNRIRAIKGRYHKFIINFINVLIMKEFPIDYSKLKLKYLTDKISKDTSISRNKKLLEEHLYDFLNKKISTKFKQLQPDKKNYTEMSQKQKINTIMENRAIKEILNLSYEDFYLNFFVEEQSDYQTIYAECKSPSLKGCIEQIKGGIEYKRLMEKTARTEMLSHFKSGKERKQRKKESFE